MQPLAYLAVRCCIGWIQFLEHSGHAFVCNVPVVLTTGPVHCWSIVYALFIAVHLRTYRQVGHAEYEEQLPLWMWGIETITVVSTAAWWLASCGLAFARIVSDDMFGLPSSRYDTYTPQLFRFVVSKGFREALSAVHMASGIGLFASVLFLCFAIPFMAGDFAVYEFCMLTVASTFALAHVVLAVCSATGDFNEWELAGTLGAAAEASSLGPQLCVMFTLAGVPWQAAAWQRAFYLSAVTAFAAAVVACGWQPPRAAGVAVPPSHFELGTCAALNLVAVAALLLCFPPLSVWPMWLLGALLVAIGFCLTLPDLRGSLMELCEPVMPLRSDRGRGPPAPLREVLRSSARILVLLCSLVILWDLAVHTHKHVEHETSHEADMAHAMHGEAEAEHEPTPGSWMDTYPDKWSADTRLLLRWSAEQAKEFPGQDVALEYAAEALGLEKGKLAPIHLFPEYNLLLFKFLGPNDLSRPHYNVHEHWQELVLAPYGHLAGVVDGKFPAYLDAGICLELPVAPEGGLQSLDTTAIEHTLRHITDESDDHARMAYAAACGHWRHEMFPDEDSHPGGYDGASYEDIMEARHAGEEWSEDMHMEDVHAGEAGPGPGEHFEQAMPPQEPQG